MKALPVGIQDFDIIRQNGMLYVDKTAKLLELARQPRRCFLARPRRFGKSLTVSTLNAMFRGKAELFEGLAAEDWVRGQRAAPKPVLSLDLSSLALSKTAEDLNDALGYALDDWADRNALPRPASTSANEKLNKIIQDVYAKSGPLAILIDEYDKPILDNITNIKKATSMREMLHSFYLVLKSCDHYINFLFITGVSKFTKTSIFSSMNNLDDITFSQRYGDIVGYTQSELETCFSEWIETTTAKKSLSRQKLLADLQRYYDGFSFDGATKVYNPYSILKFFEEGEFDNYWYASGSPSFLVKWLKRRKVQSPEQYRHIKVMKSFNDSHDIENTDVASFLFQSGYLTIENKQGNIFTLDIPNNEVLNSLSLLFMENIYNEENIPFFIENMIHAFETLDIEAIVEAYNKILARLPFEAYKNRGETWYSSIFMTMIHCSGSMYYAEVHTFFGKSDLVIQYKNNIILIEFKFAEKISNIETKKQEGFAQIQQRRYEKSYHDKDTHVASAVVVATDEKRQADCFLLTPSR